MLARDAADDPTHRPDVGSVVAVLGEPAGRVPLGGCTLLAFDRPALRDFAAADPVVAVSRWQAGADALTLPGWFLRPPAGELIVCGPYLRLAPGRYRVGFEVTAAAGDRAAGWVDVFLDDPAGGPTERLLARTVPAGFSGELGGEIEVRRHDPQRLAFRASADGGGLTVTAVRLSRGDAGAVRAVR